MSDPGAALAAAIDAPAVDAVLLDVGGVLMLPEPTRIGEALTSAGLEPPADLVRFRLAHYRGALAYDRSGDRPETWPAYLGGYAEALGFGDDDRALAALVDIWDAPGHGHWAWRQDAAVSALGRLAAGGLRLGIVSNSDGTVEHALQAHNVCQVGPGPGVAVEVIVDSEVVGHQKPDPAIFAVALDVLDLDPSRVLYIGDTVRNDVRGAEAASIPVVQLDPYGLYPDEPHVRAESLGDVATTLGA
jgi:putative hydrolase of the HAD superfamily